MCIGKGMIIRKGQRHPDYAMDSNDHSPLVKLLHLRDDKPIETRNFIRIELWPCDSLTSTNPDDWEFKIDEQGYLPAWFEDKKEDWEYKCLRILTKKIIPTWIKKGVGRYLDLRGTQVKSLGSLQSVGGYLDLEGTQVKSLGSLQSVGGFLYLEGTQVKSLGSLQSVGGYLDLRGTQVKSLPKKLKVNGRIYR